MAQNKIVGFCLFRTLGWLRFVAARPLLDCGAPAPLSFGPKCGCAVLNSYGIWHKWNCAPEVRALSQPHSCDADRAGAARRPPVLRGRVCFAKIRCQFGRAGSPLPAASRINSVPHASTEERLVAALVRARSTGFKAKDRGPHEQPRRAVDCAPYQSCVFAVKNTWPRAMVWSWQNAFPVGLSRSGIAKSTVPLFPPMPASLVICAPHTALCDIELRSCAAPKTISPRPTLRSSRDIMGSGSSPHSLSPRWH